MTPYGVMPPRGSPGGRDTDLGGKEPQQLVRLDPLRSIPLCVQAQVLYQSRHVTPKLLNKITGIEYDLY